jgi:serine/threonine-protein kinase
MLNRDLSLSLEMRELIDSLCDDFESRWRSAPRPQIEDFLPRLSPDCRGRLLSELLGIELELRRAEGDSPGFAEYRDRFPELLTVVEDHFRPSETVRELSRVAGSLNSVPGFEILEQIGRGGMGVVYRAVQQKLNRIVALKRIVSGECAAPSERARFLAEAENAARVAHPNVVHVFEIGEHEGQPFLAMEYVAGGTLVNRLAQGPLAPSEAAGLLLSLTQAIVTAHAAGVIHRDLKPANILLSQATAEGEITAKVTDFGLARRLDDAGLGTRTGQLLGTPAYMAPEQAVGSKEVGPAADLYALGTILYEMLTGRPPFRAASITETLDLVRTAEPVPPQPTPARYPSRSGDDLSEMFGEVAERSLQIGPRVGLAIATVP